MDIRYYILMRLPYRKPGKYSQIKIDPLLTKEKFNDLKKNFERLKKTQLEAASEVRRLAEFGDFSENVEYQLAKGRLRGINNRIVMLEHQLNQAVIIQSNEKTDVVRIGHTITIQQGGTRKRYQILGSSETNPQKGIISHTSPIGEALLGHRTGEKIKIMINNKEVEYVIEKIE